ncbi:type III pantothenate kinase [Helicobacter pylori]|uniref:Type III pantothenate kinase n=1 Tax=Helicobacter pylori (strain SouthAfrica7) TaxID=907239 RepID=E8QS58_HELPW|nr:type III pantothenate kinase [Helicobacter pylori]ADU84822.1 pantothenate kinase [Helicobacter pylori SouthAfrica7]
MPARQSFKDLKNLVLCDIGNTRIHFAQGYQLFSSAKEDLKRLDIQKEIFYISVNEENEKALLDCYPNAKNLAGFFHLETDYIGLGIDRQMACLAVDNGVVVDAGSAITIDLIKDSKHLGGCILPGLAQYTHAYRKSAKILEQPFKALDSLEILPQNTRDAVNYGMILSVIACIQHLAKDEKIYLCGGDAKFLSAFLVHSVCKERLVFDGMEIALKKAGILECK